MRGPVRKSFHPEVCSKNEGFRIASSSSVSRAILARLAGASRVTMRAKCSLLLFTSLNLSLLGSLNLGSSSFDFLLGFTSLLWLNDVLSL